MTIEALINKTDSFEIVRDAIAAILKTETVAQEALAVVEGLDPRLWRFRVFVDRSAPWQDWMNPPAAAQLDTSPIVNVALQTLSFNRSAGNIVERQRARGIYHVDCLGYGISQTDGAGGHIPGDQRAAQEAQRAARLVRNILMAADHAYLGLRGTVGGRWISSIQISAPSDPKAVQQVVGARLVFEVDFDERSPQVEGEPLCVVAANVVRTDTGELMIRAALQTDDALTEAELAALMTD